MQGFFNTDSAASESEDLTKKGMYIFFGLSVWFIFVKLCMNDCSQRVFTSTHLGKKNKGTKRYIPQKNSVAFALLITLYK